MSKDTSEKQMPVNGERRIALGALIFFIIFAIGIFIPGMTEIDMMRYGFGIATISFFFSIMSLVTSVIYFMRASSFDKVIHGVQILHWVYDKEKWLRYAEEEFTRQKEEKWNIWKLILVISIVVGVIAGFTLGAFVFVFATLFFLMLLLAFVAFFVPIIKYSSDRRRKPEAILSKNGIYITGEFHNWDMLTSKLSNVFFDKGNSLLSITYTYLTRTGPSDYTVRIPVPGGKEKDAERAVKALMG